MATKKSMDWIVPVGLVGGGLAVVYVLSKGQGEERTGGASLGGFMPDLGFLGDIFSNLPTNTIIEKFSETAQMVRDAAGNIVDDVKDKIPDATDIWPGILDPLGVSEWGDNAKEWAGSVISKAKTEIEDASGLSIGKTALATVGGAGAIGILSGTMPPVAAIVIVGPLAALGGSKLRDMTYRKSGKKPEVLVKDFFKNLFSGSNPYGYVLNPFLAAAGLVKNKILVDVSPVASVNATVSNVVSKVSRTGGGSSVRQVSVQPSGNPFKDVFQGVTKIPVGGGYYDLINRQSVFTG